MGELEEQIEKAVKKKKKAEKIKKAVTWGGSLGSVGTIAAASFADPESTKVVLAEVSKSPAILGVVILVAAWRLFGKDLMEHLTKIQVTLGCIEVRLGEISDRLEIGDERMNRQQKDIEEIKTRLGAAKL